MTRAEFSDMMAAQAKIKEALAGASPLAPMVTIDYLHLREALQALENKICESLKDPFDDDLEQPSAEGTTAWQQRNGVL